MHVRNSQNETLLMRAAAQGKLEVVKYLVTLGANFNARTKEERKLPNGNVIAADGYTALFFAANNGQLKVVEYLVDNGADVNAINKEDGATPLGLARSRGYTDVVEFLKSRGAAQ